MRNHEEINVLKEAQRNASRAVKAIDALMGKVYNEEFAYELTSERNRFQDFERKAEAGLWEHGLMPKDSSLERAKLWGAIQANSKGIAGLLKVRHNNKSSGSFANELAEELMDFEEENIERLKKFL